MCDFFVYQLLLTISESCSNKYLNFEDIPIFKLNVLKNEDLFENNYTRMFKL